MRRGIVVGTMLTILVVTAGFLLVLLVLFKGKAILGLESTDATCRASILLTKAADKVRGPGCVQLIENPAPLSCPRRFVTVTSSAGKVGDVELGKKYDKKCPDGSDGCLASRVVAEEMRRCWDVFGKGHEIAFQQVDQNWDFRNNEMACFICSEVTLGTQVDGFTKYLKETMMLDAEERYFDFLARDTKAYCGLKVEKGKTCWETFGDENNQKLNQEVLEPGTYAIVFAREGLASAGSTTGGDCKEFKGTFTVQAVPVKQMQAVCGQVIA